MINGQCYCGAVRIHSKTAPRTVLYCHCSDCKRASGAPVAAFAAFDEADLSLSDAALGHFSRVAGVTRSFCRTCGSPVAGRYDYLPGQVFVSLGLLDEAERLEPELHAHHGNCLSWLKIDDGLERVSGSSRDEIG